MLTPVPMVRVELLALDRDLEELSRGLGQWAVLHPMQVAELGGWAESLTWPEMDQLAGEYNLVERRLERVAGFLRLDSDVTAGESIVAPDETLSRARALLEQIEPEIKRLDDEIHSIQARRVRGERIEQLLGLLADLDVDISSLRSLNYLHLIVGMVPPEKLLRLEESLEEVPHLLLSGRRVNGRVLLFAFSLPNEAAVLDRALQSAYVERLEIPSELTGTPSQARAQLRLRDEELTGEVEDLEQQRRHLREQWGQDVYRTLELVRTNSRTVELWRKVGATARTRLLVGWIPRDRYPQFASNVDSISRGRSILTESEVLPTGNGDGPVAPTALRNPRLFRSFEKITETYGLPSYWDIDPTVLAGILFVLFFGAMFGDLGEGIILLLLGIMFTKGFLLKGQRDFGLILAGCGAASMVFGILYGEAFGSDEIFPALWFRPLDEPLLIIGVAIGLGIVVLSVGLILGIVTAWRQRDWAAFYFGQNGLVGLWLYWGLLAIALIVALAPQILTLWVLLILVAAPALLIFLHGPILHALGWSDEVGGGSYYVQAGVETIDLMVRLISNTISFLRIGAFALGHVGLGLTVFAIAELVRGLPGAYGVVIILGNVLIIVLETLIVGIQALRLEYYELFTKFLSGRGVAYRPFSLASPLSGAGLSERED